MQARLSDQHLFTECQWCLYEPVSMPLACLQRNSPRRSAAKDGCWLSSKGQAERHSLLQHVPPYLLRARLTWITAAGSLLRQREPSSSNDHQQQQQ